MSDLMFRPTFEGNGLNIYLNPALAKWAFSQTLESDAENEMSKHLRQGDSNITSCLAFESFKGTKLPSRLSMDTNTGLVGDKLGRTLERKGRLFVYKAHNIFRPSQTGVLIKLFDSWAKWANVGRPKIKENILDPVLYDTKMAGLVLSQIRAIPDLVNLAMNTKLDETTRKNYCVKVSKLYGELTGTSRREILDFHEDTWLIKEIRIGTDEAVAANVGEYYLSQGRPLIYVAHNLKTVKDSAALQTLFQDWAEIAYAFCK